MRTEQQNSLIAKKARPRLHKVKISIDTKIDFYYFNSINKIHEQ